MCLHIDQKLYINKRFFYRAQLLSGSPSKRTSQTLLLLCSSDVSTDRPKSLVPHILLPSQYYWLYYNIFIIDPPAWLSYSVLLFQFFLKKVLLLIWQHRLALNIVCLLCLWQCFQAPSAADDLCVKLLAIRVRFLGAFTKVTIICDGFRDLLRIVCSHIPQQP